MRIKFRKGQQRKFLQKVLEKVDSPSLRELSRRIDVNYSSLKNYYVEARFLSESLFNDLCYLAKFDLNLIKFEKLGMNWGQIKGGKKGKR